MKIGNLELKNKVFLSPMAGVTDLPFRLICKEQGCGLLYTEMINGKALCYDDENTKKMLKIEEEEHPVAVQIFGSVSIILGIMILPTIVGMSVSALKAVPDSYYEGAVALGAADLIEEVADHVQDRKSVV